MASSGSGKLDNKKDKSIGIYQLKTSNESNVAIGGIDNTKTMEKSVSILIHWNTNAKETEQKAYEIYNKLLNELLSTFIESKNQAKKESIGIIKITK